MLCEKKFTSFLIFYFLFISVISFRIITSHWIIFQQQYCKDECMRIYLMHMPFTHYYAFSCRFHNVMRMMILLAGGRNKWKEMENVEEMKIILMWHILKYKYLCVLDFWYLWWVFFFVDEMIIYGLAGINTLINLWIFFQSQNFSSCNIQKTSVQPTIWR